MNEETHKDCERDLNKSGKNGRRELAKNGSDDEAEHGKYECECHEQDGLKKKSHTGADEKTC